MFYVVCVVLSYMTTKKAHHMRKHIFWNCGMLEAGPPTKAVDLCFTTLYMVCCYTLFFMCAVHIIKLCLICDIVFCFEFRCEFNMNHVI